MRKIFLVFCMVCVMIMNITFPTFAEDTTAPEQTLLEETASSSETFQDVETPENEEDSGESSDTTENDENTNISASSDEINAVDGVQGVPSSPTENETPESESSESENLEAENPDTEILPQDNPDFEFGTITDALDQLGTTRTQAEAIAWVKSKVGQHIDTDGYPAGQPYQCVDLIKAYYTYLGVSPVSGNGADYTWNSLPSGWSRIAGAVPQAGDILVYTGGYGHVAIFESTYSTYHQNFNNHNYVERVTYAYNGFSNSYWGVIRPNWGSTPSSLSFGNDDCQWDTTNAFIYTKATASGSGVFTGAGMTVWDRAGNVVAFKNESINTRSSYLEIWYNITNDTGVQLISGQRYTYQFYTVYNGNRYYSPIKTFITNSITPAQVTNVKARSVGINTTKITWNRVSNAQGYLIYASKNGKYAYCGMTSNTSFTDKKALSSAYNFYWVYAYVKNADGKMTCGSCQKYTYARAKMPAVANLRASSSSGGVRLTWKSVPGAEGYLIYGKTSNGKYGYKGMTTRGTSFTDKKASRFVYNFYWVFPYYKLSSNKMIVGSTPKYVYGKAL